MEFGLHISASRNWQHTVFSYMNFQVTYHFTTNDTRRELYGKQIGIAEIRTIWFLAHCRLVLVPVMWTPEQYFRISHLAELLQGTDSHSQRTPLMGLLRQKRASEASNDHMRVRVSFYYNQLRIINVSLQLKFRNKI
jgi:hypothetical protein